MDAVRKGREGDAAGGERAAGKARSDAYDYYEDGYLAGSIRKLMEENPANVLWPRVYVALLKGDQHHRQDRESTARLAELVQRIEELNVELEAFRGDAHRK
jgi:hypothetical protein